MSRPASAAGGRDDLALELAATAARLIAEDGCDYATAKRKAVQLVLGDAAGARGRLPENDLVESELRRYLRTFGGERHAALLAELRAVALELMEFLAPFHPHLVTDSAKDVEIFLLNERVRFGVEEADEPAGALETIHMQLPRRLLKGRSSPLDAVLIVLPTDAVRTSPRFRSSDSSLSPIERAGRAGLPALRALLSAPGSSG